MYIFCHAGLDPASSDSSVPIGIHRGERTTSLDTGLRRYDGPKPNPEDRGYDFPCFPEVSHLNYSHY